MSGKMMVYSLLQNEATHFLAQRRYFTARGSPALKYALEFKDPP